jgi:hypothetical protein
MRPASPRLRRTGLPSSALRRACWLVAAAPLVALSPRPALAVCDLSQVVGYTLVFGKTIQGYIEDGKQVAGFEGCTRDRVLVFIDNTGVRCKDTVLHSAHLPTAYLFARNANDMKLCVDDDMYDVAQAN